MAASMITVNSEQVWDVCELESLLALKEVAKESAEFGFLLRHSWKPATELQCWFQD